LVPGFINCLSVFFNFVKSHCTKISEHYSLTIEEPATFFNDNFSIRPQSELNLFDPMDPMDPLIPKSSKQQNEFFSQVSLNFFLPQGDGFEPWTLKLRVNRTVLHWCL
jgi:hypothetical protein